MTVSPWSWLAAIVALVVIYGSRSALLRLLPLPVATEQLVWIAPRGLITVLLFLKVQESFELPGYLSGATILVVLGSSALILATRRADKQAVPETEQIPPEPLETEQTPPETITPEK